MPNSITVNNLEVTVFQKEISDYISLTDIARAKNAEFPADVVKNWMRNRSTIEFLGLWEKINNPNFKLVEFDSFRSQAGLNSFVLSPQKWIENTEAIGIVSKSGRYSGGTFAHKDIAFEFASWISAEFKLYLIKEFQRLKEEESKKLELGWDARRQLTKINYKIHTDAIKQHIVPQLTEKDAKFVYASEADVLNKALFGLTASQWKDKNPNKEGNMRDYADVYELVCLANLETHNAEFIKQGLTQSQRVVKLNSIAISQMKSLVQNISIRKLSQLN
jgi:hypothetical protein